MGKVRVLTLDEWNSLINTVTDICDAINEVSDTIGEHLNDDLGGNLEDAASSLRKIRDLLENGDIGEEADSLEDDEDDPEDKEKIDKVVTEYEKDKDPKDK